MADWFRSWHGAPTDPKWLVIARNADVSPAIVSAVVWALFDYASQHEDRGTVLGFDVETYSVWSGLSEPEVLGVICALQEKGIIEDGRLANWDKRQPKREDDSRDRVRAHRARKRDTEDVTHSNAPEERRGETEAETETEAEETRGARARHATPDELVEVYLDFMGESAEAATPEWRRKARRDCAAVAAQGFDARMFRRYLAYRSQQAGRTMELRWIKDDIVQWRIEGSPESPSLLPAVRGSPSRTRQPDFSGNRAVANALRAREGR